MRLFRCVIGLGLLLANASAFTHEAIMHELLAANVVPDAERESALKKGFSGPAENRGVTSVTPVGSVVLGGEFDGMQGRMLRAREIVIAPGGVIAVHEHQQRPGVAYIIEGEIIEHRNDQQEPLVRRPGDAAFEKTGVVHWWENRSDKPVRALVVDVVPES